MLCDLKCPHQNCSKIELINVKYYACLPGEHHQNQIPAPKERKDLLVYYIDKQCALHSIPELITAGIICAYHFHRGEIFWNIFALDFHSQRLHSLNTRLIEILSSFLTDFKLQIFFAQFHANYFIFQFQNRSIFCDFLTEWSDLFADATNRERRNWCKSIADDLQGNTTHLKFVHWYCNEWHLLLLIFMCFRNNVSDGQIEEHQDMRGSVQQYFECA